MESPSRLVSGWEARDLQLLFGTQLESVVDYDIRRRRSLPADLWRIRYHSTALVPRWKMDRVYFQSGWKYFALDARSYRWRSTKDFDSGTALLETDGENFF